MVLAEMFFPYPKSIFDILLVDISEAEGIVEIRDGRVKVNVDVVCEDAHHVRVLRRLETIGDGCNNAETCDAPEELDKAIKAAILLETRNMQPPEKRVDIEFDWMLRCIFRMCNVIAKCDDEGLRDIIRLMIHEQDENMYEKIVACNTPKDMHKKVYTFTRMFMSSDQNIIFMNLRLLLEMFNDGIL